jgi:hypothetical protein
MRNKPRKFHALMTHFLPSQNEKSNHDKLSILPNFNVWQAACEQLLKKPFPPQSSDFSKEALERDGHITLSSLSNWELICQEILDTEFSHLYYQKCYDELRQRGKSEQEIFEMRRLAWYTAGWLNYVMMAWDWVHIDESDILRATERLHDNKQISQEKRIEFENLVKMHAS